MTGDKQSVSSTVLWISLRALWNILLVFILVEGFTNAYYFSYKVFTDIPYVAASEDTRTVFITEGENVFTIAETLEQNGIVESKYLFIVRAYLGEYNQKLKAGEYILGPAMTPDEICKEICGMQSEETT